MYSAELKMELIVPKRRNISEQHDVTIATRSAVPRSLERAVNCNHVSECYMLFEWSSVFGTIKEILGKNSKATRRWSYKTTAVFAGLCGYELGVTTDCVKKHNSKF
jgi:hypothetical protein